MNPAQFRQWWGAYLSPGAQVVMFQGNGLGSTGDGIRLWGPSAVNDADVVDSVDFGATFTYSPTTGVFDAYSTHGVGSEWRLVTDKSLA